jgi:hypothetical protein
MTEPVIPSRRLWWLVAAFGIWGSAHILIYTLHAVGCEFAWPAVTLRVIFAVVITTHVGALVWMWFRINAMPDKNSRFGSFLHAVVIWSIVAAIVATIFSFGPALILTTCT